MNSEVGRPQESMKTSSKIVQSFRKQINELSDDELNTILNHVWYNLTRLESMAKFTLSDKFIMTISEIRTYLQKLYSGD